MASPKGPRIRLLSVQYRVNMLTSLNDPAPPRPTFSDLWHRVAGLRPRLATTVRVHRQRFRGETWYVCEDPASNRFFRANTPGYRFLALLDGHRTVEDAWRTVAAALGDEAPTQGEAIQVLNQLHEADLLHHDASTALEPVLVRNRRTARREFRSHLGALLFIRIPLFNPDRLLNTLTPLAAPFVSMWGLVLWLGLVIVGLWTVVGGGDRFFQASTGILATENLLALYLTIAIIKLAHELGHGLMLKVLGRRVGGAHVYRVGVLLLLFLPFPYVDASGAWAFSSKWKRALVGSAGMLVELAIASICAVVWANAGEGTLTASLAYNALLAASVSTLLFNANPLLRYDGYHILSDLLEVPNLAARATGHVGYLIKRYAFGVTGAITTAHTPLERSLFVGYAIASTVYRLVIYAVIGLFVLDQQFALGALLLVVAAAELVVTPLWKHASFLATSNELTMRRGRALVVASSATALLLLFLLAVPLPRHARLQGVVEPAAYQPVFAESDGELVSIAASGERLDAGSPIVTLEHDELAYRARVLGIERDRLSALRRQALRDGAQERAAVEERLVVVIDELAHVLGRLEAMVITASESGVWFGELRGGDLGRFVRAGDAVGVLVTSEGLVVRAPVSESVSGDLGASQRISVRADGGGAAGVGAAFVRFTPTAEGRGPDRTEGVVAEYRLEGAPGWLPGQRVYIRARVGTATLAQRAWESVLRVFEQRGEG